MHLIAEARTERSLSDSLILTHRDELQKSHSNRQPFKKPPSVAHARIIQQLAPFDRSFDAFAKYLGFCGFFVQFSLNAMAVFDAQLPQEERPHHEFIEHLRKSPARASSSSASQSTRRSAPSSSWA